MFQNAVFGRINIIIMSMGGREEGTNISVPNNFKFN